MKALIHVLARLGLFREDLDYQVLRAAMVLTFFFFGYQKWFEYEAQALIPFISSGPLISWLYPVFGIRGASWFLGTAEWTFGTLLLLGFWNRTLGMFASGGSGCHLRLYRHHHSLRAGWLGGLRRWLSGNGTERRLPDEGRGAVRGFLLPAASGRTASQPGEIGLADVGS